MYRVIALLFVLSGNVVAGEFYAEGGLFYSAEELAKYSYTVDDVSGERIYDYNYKTNTIAHLAAGYEFDAFTAVKDLTIDIQLRHESDPGSYGKKDPISNNSIGLIIRKKFSR